MTEKTEEQIAKEKAAQSAMSREAHTPGPWDVTTVDHSSGGGGATPSTLFRVGFRSQKDFTGHVADKCHGDSYANARLIASAPEQFGIIKEFIEWVDRFTGTLPEAQSDALFDIYRRARATYRNVDQVAHDASREAALLQARVDAG